VGAAYREYTLAPLPGRRPVIAVSPIPESRGDRTLTGPNRSASAADSNEHCSVKLHNAGSATASLLICAKTPRVGRAVIFPLSCGVTL